MKQQAAKVETFNPFETKDFSEGLMKNLNKIDEKSIRTRFKNAQDPINLAFETIENTSLKTLAKDFVKETFFDFVSFVTEVCK